VLGVTPAAASFYDGQPGCELREAEAMQSEGSRGRARVSARTKSSTASREAPISRNSVPAGNERTN
jgi:hypothetical protein